jgi:hypothetical protein
MRDFETLNELLCLLVSFTKGALTNTAAAGRRKEGGADAI